MCFCQVGIILRDDLHAVHFVKPDDSLVLEFCLPSKSPYINKGPHFRPISTTDFVQPNELTDVVLD